MGTKVLRRLWVDVPFDQVEVGEEVRMRITAAIAISVVKPDKS